MFTRLEPFLSVDTCLSRLFFSLLGSLVCISSSLPAPHPILHLADLRRPAGVSPFFFLYVILLQLPTSSAVFTLSVLPLSSLSSIPNLVFTASNSVSLKLMIKSVQLFPFFAGIFVCFLRLSLTSLNLLNMFVFSSLTLFPPSSIWSKPRQVSVPAFSDIFPPLLSLFPRVPQPPVKDIRPAYVFLQIRPCGIFTPDKLFPRFILPKQLLFCNLALLARLTPRNTSLHRVLVPLPDDPFWLFSR